MSDLLNSDPDVTVDTVAEASSAEVTTEATQATQPTDWTADIAEDIRDNVNIKKYMREDMASSFNELAKANLNLHNVVGADKIAIPNENSTKEQWDETYAKLGRPDENTGYTFGEGSDEGIIGEFGPIAFDAGLSQSQVDKMVEFHNTLIEKAGENNAQDWENFKSESTEALHKEWGNKFDTELATSNRAYNHFLDKETQAQLAENGLANHPALVKMFNQIGREMMEDSVGATTSGNVKSPQEAQSAINAIRNDAKHPFFLKGHPNHKAATQEMEALYNDLYPSNSEG